MDLFTLGLRIQSEGLGEAKRGLAGLDAQGKGLQQRFSLLKASIVGTAIVGFATKLIRESIEAQNTLAQLEAAVKSTGGAAGLSVAQLEDMASALQKTTIYSDDAVKAAQSVLLTFTEIRGPEFKGAIQAITDLSARMGTDLKTSALQVGKALQEPVAGINALRRAGVSFSESQKEVIKNLVETGQTAKAQQMILKELETQFGGSAEAARNTLGGALAALGNAWSDLFEVTSDSSTGMIGAINRLSEALDRNKEKWHRWAGMLLDDSGGPLAGLNKVMAMMNRVGNWLHQNPWAGGGRGGGGGGGRDTPTGPLSMSPAVVMAGKPVPRNKAGGGKAGKGKSAGLPNIDIDFGGLRQFEPGGDPVSEEIGGGVPDWMTKLYESRDAYRKAMADFKAKIAEDTAAAAAEIGSVVQNGFAQTLGDAIYNAFSAAFNGEGLGGIFKAFGKTILAGIGQTFTQLGMIYLQYGGIMQALAAFLPNPFTAGWAGIAIGSALIAMGAALGAVASRGGGAGRGTASSGAFREPNRSEELTRYKFLNRDGSIVNSLSPRSNVNVTIIGPDDPKAQRAITELVEKASRRAA